MILPPVPPSSRMRRASNPVDHFRNAITFGGGIPAGSVDPDKQSRVARKNTVINEARNGADRIDEHTCRAGRKVPSYVRLGIAQNFIVDLCLFFRRRSK